MKVIGATAAQVGDVVREVSRRLYDGNVVIKSLSDKSNRRGGRATFTIRTVDSRAGRRGAVGNPSRTGTGPHGYGRRIGACWHAHWDVIEELFRRHPDAQVRSGGLPIDGKDLVYTAATFRERALVTAHLPVGRVDEDVTLPQCCECDHTRYTTTAPIARPELRHGWMAAGQDDGLPSQVRITGDEPDWMWGPDYYVTSGSDGVPEQGDEIDPWWASHYEAGRPDTAVPYLGGLVAAQPAQPRRRSDDVLDRIDRELEAGIG